ncbi:MAG: ABC transporter permease, partial [Candidatus Limnocylindrales bacterium]
MSARSWRLGGTRGLPITVLVARREVRVRLRSRVFMGGTIVMTALVVIGIVAAALLAGRTTPVRVGFSGGAQALEPTFTASAAALGANVTASDIADVTVGEAQVTAGTLDVLVTGSATAPTAVAKAAIASNVETALSLAAEAARLSDAGLSPAAVASAMALVPVQLLQPPDRKDTENVFASLALGILLWIALGQYGTMVAQGVVEEKATRIMEILLATIQPSRLLAGKVIGIGLVGLLQLTIVGAAALVAVRVTDVATIPALGVTSILGDISWFLLGFLFYATAYAAVASLVSRQEEVQSAVAPIGILQIAGYLLMYVTLANPTSPLVIVCSMLPPFAPILMAVRMAASDVPFWQVGLAVALIVASIGGLTWLAGRVYANAALRLGTRVRFMDAFRGSRAWVGPACPGPVGPQRSEEGSD